MICFGGDIKVTSVFENKNELYYLMNFNDFGMSIITLFHLLVINNWFVTCDMYVQTIDKNISLIRLYFISFWVVAVLIFLNLLISMVIEIYSSVESTVDQENNKQCLT